MSRFVASSGKGKLQSPTKNTNIKNCKLLYTFFLVCLSKMIDLAKQGDEETINSWITVSSLFLLCYCLLRRFYCTWEARGQVQVALLRHAFLVIAPIARNSGPFRRSRSLLNFSMIGPIFELVLHGDDHDPSLTSCWCFHISAVITCNGKSENEAKSVNLHANKRMICWPIFWKKMYLGSHDLSLISCCSFQIIAWSLEIIVH